MLNPISVNSIFSHSIVFFLYNIITEHISSNLSCLRGFWFNQVSFYVEIDEQAQKYTDVEQPDISEYSGNVASVEYKQRYINNNYDKLGLKNKEIKCFVI